MRGLRLLRGRRVYLTVLHIQSWKGLNCTLLVWARFPEKALAWCGPNLFVADKKQGRPL